jgi:hypothetical protein
MTLSLPKFPSSPLVGKVDEKIMWLMLSSLIPSLMGEVKNLITLSLQKFPFSPLVGEEDENGAVVDPEQPGPLPHG